MYSFLRSILILGSVVFSFLEINAQCAGTISYVNYDNTDSLFVNETPISYCFDNFESSNAGAPLVSPINGIFIPFFVNTEAELTEDIYAGSTLSSSAGTIYDIVGSGRINNGEASIYVQFLNLQAADLENDNITISFMDATGNCQHALTINVANDLPANPAATCETFECEFAFKIEYINWEAFNFVNEPIAYCAEELTALYPEDRGTYDGGRTNADKPGVYIPFLVRTNASAFIFEGASLTTSNGAIYQTTEPPTPSDGVAENSIFFLYLTEGNLSENLININFADSTGVCSVRQTLNITDQLPDLDLNIKCIPQNCGDDLCNGIEDYANCPNDCPCDGSIEFISWPELEVLEKPLFYCAENLDIDTINYNGGNTNLAEPGVYIPFVINTEALTNLDNQYEGSKLISNVGQIYNSTNPPSIFDNTVTAIVYFLYVTEADLDETNLTITFNDGFGGCTHVGEINVPEDVPNILPLPDCPCNSEFNFINWNSKNFTDMPIAYCAEQIGDFSNWGTNVADPALFIPFVIESGATLNEDTTVFTGSSLTSSAGIIYNTTSPPGINDGQARIFIHLLAITQSDLENENISLNFEEPSGKCAKSITINVATDLINVDPAVCLEATCGNNECEAVENYLNCPADCDCAGSIQYLQFEEWPTLTLSDGPTPYCIESLVQAGVEASTDTLNPGIFIPFTIVTDAPVNEDGFFNDSKINADIGTIYDVTAPPIEHTGNVTTAHYLYLTEQDLAAGGNTAQIAFSYSTNICSHSTVLNFEEALPDLNIRMQCLNSDCGNMVCEPAEDYSSCSNDCPCTGNINFINWETKTDIIDPKAYCFVDLSNADNQIDESNNSVFIPFVVRTDAALGADSLYQGSQLSAGIGTIYNSLDVPVVNDGTAGIFLQFLHLTKADLENNTESVLAFENENGQCKHEIPVVFSDLTVNFEVCKEVSVNNLEAQNILINPNPVDRFLNVQFINDVKHIQSISIYNINSQLIEVKNIDTVVDNLQIDVGTYKAGTYFVNFELNDGSIAAKRIIKK